MKPRRPPPPCRGNCTAAPQTETAAPVWRSDTVGEAEGKTGNRNSRNHIRKVFPLCHVVLINSPPWKMDEPEFCVSWDSG